MFDKGVSVMLRIGLGFACFLLWTAPALAQCKAPQFTKNPGKGPATTKARTNLPLPDTFPDEISEPFDPFDIPPLPDPFDDPFDDLPDLPPLPDPFDSPPDLPDPFDVPPPIPPLPDPFDVPLPPDPFGDPTSAQSWGGSICGGSSGASGKARPLTPAARTLHSRGQASQVNAFVDVNRDGHPDAVRITPTGVLVILLAADGLTVLSRHQISVGFTPTPTTTQMIVKDMNGDGKPDLVLSNYGSVTGGSDTGAVFILLGNGDGTFGAPRSFPAGLNPGSLAALDYNHDGKPDLAVANVNSGTISLLPGNGDGTFGAPVAISTGEDLQGVPASILALDLNGDGAPDLVVANRNDNSISVLLSSAGAFGQPRITPIPCNPVFLAYNDFNNDGKPDLAAACPKSNAFVILTGNGDGTFQPPVSYGAGNSPASIGVLPLRDGSSEIFTADHVTRELLFTPVTPQGDVAAPPFNTVGGHPTGIAAADLNNDGQPDVVITGGSSDVSVMIAQSGTQFKAPVGYSLGPSASGAQAVALGDLNGDNRPDVIVANLGNGGNPFGAPTGSVSVFLNNGDGTLKSPTTTTVNETAQSLALGDFNKDGKLDVAVAAYGDQFGGADQGAVTVLLGKGDGTFQPSPAVLTVAGLHPVAVAQGDLNGDGKLDLAVLMVGTLAQPATLAIFLGEGNGAFAAARTFPLQALADIHGGVAIGDVNGDGKLDVAVVTSYGGQLIDILLGDGAGGFVETAAAASNNPGPRSVILTDLNGDGRLDLVLSDSSQDATYLLGNGDGTFQTEQHFVSGAAPVAIAATRFAGSNGPDLVVAHNGGTWLSLVNDFPAAGPPVPGSSNPPAGSGVTQTFTFTFTDAASYENFAVADVLINNALDGRQACYVAFAPSGPNSGSVYLVDNAGDAGGPYSGMLLPGSGTVQNSQCTITGSGSSASGTGNILTLTLAIAFSASFSGNKVVYLSAQDKSAANSGWLALGTWNVPSPPPAGPWVTGMSPASSYYPALTYTFTYTDSNGFQDISVANILVNGAIDGRRACYVAFVPATSSVLLVDDAGDAGGPYSGMVLPSSGSVSNSQCTIYGAGSSVTGSGNTLTLTLAMSFSLSFAGNQLFFLAARNASGQNSNWQAVGSAAIP